MSTVAAIEMIPFNNELTSYFTRLNIAWLEKYFVLETIDQEMLDHPKAYFIDKGGHIFFAKINDEIAGTFALLKESDTVYELSKMAVDEQYQGLGIGNRMIEFSIAKARALNATRVILYSNTKLQPAIHLYKKYGFTEVPILGSQYNRSNFNMELEIK